VKLVGTNIELQLQRTRLSQELRRMFSRLERCRRENAQIRDTLAYLLNKNQHQKNRILEIEKKEKHRMETIRDLACASALLQLQDDRGAL
jgi:predicted nuclease with TOPRIM domain